jgi:hypothetical protein
MVRIRGHMKTRNRNCTAPQYAKAGSSWDVEVIEKQTNKKKCTARSEAPAYRTKEWLLDGWDEAEHVSRAQGQDISPVKTPL